MGMDAHLDQLVGGLTALNTTALAGTTAVVAIAAPTADFNIIILGLAVGNLHATQSARVVVQQFDGTTATARWQVVAGPGGGGAIHDFRKPLILGAGQSCRVITPDATATVWFAINYTIERV